MNIKRSLLAATLVLILASCQKDPVEVLNPGGGSAGDPTGSSDSEVIPGFIRIKLSEEPHDAVALRSQDGVISTGMRAFDAAANQMGITRLERTFPHAGKFEERTRREGLHLWYDVWFSEQMPSTRAAADLSDIEGIEIVSTVHKVIQASSEPRFNIMQFSHNTAGRASAYPFDDPDVNKQWGFINDGSQEWQLAGADIRIADVWKQYNGHPDIIIAIVDGGIALDNPDIQANLWINPGEIEGNGKDDDNNGYVDDVYGYNFVDMSPVITPNRHGTHVAGILAATNNNGIGVCGIAGGDGSPNSGVKLMNCQIFEHPGGNFNQEVSSRSIPAAIKYGADNGAVISTNSWGYYGPLSPADKEAIDYFIKYAGCDNNGNQLPGSPMKGGIVLFAAANVSTANPLQSTPADYEKVIGVTSLGPDFQKSPKSAYGDFIDICAPGGISDGESGIYSTTVREYGYYEYRNGTSMACPHVAGVAALVIQKYGVGKPGFTAGNLEQILLSTANNVDRYNPDYKGMLGAGCVDAAAALMDDIDISAEPFTLMNNPVTDGILYFKVDMGLSGDAVITIRNSTGAVVMRTSLDVKRYVATPLDISKLAAGYYSLEYKCSDSTVRENFIKY